MVVNDWFLVAVVKIGQVKRQTMIPNPFNISFNQTDMALLQFYFVGATILMVFLALTWTELKKEPQRKTSRIRRSST